MNNGNTSNKGNKSNKEKTFNEIAKEIPILKETERICELVKMDSDNRLDRIFYEVIKRVIVDNVGFKSPYPGFMTSEIYDTVYDHFLKVLGIR